MWPKRIVRYCSEHITGFGCLCTVAVAACLPYRAISNTPFLCPFKLLFGIPCPACGMTRAFSAFFHGNLKASFSCNELGPVLCALFMLWSIDVLPIRSTKFKKAVAVSQNAFVLCLAMNWLLRMTGTYVLLGVPFAHP